MAKLIPVRTFVPDTGKASQIVPERRQAVMRTAAFSEQANVTFRPSCMRLAATLFLILSMALFPCPDIEKSVDAYVAENFAADEENPVQVHTKIIRLSPAVTAVQFHLPAEKGDNDAQPKYLVAFFTGSTKCEFAQQWDGQVAEVVDFERSKFVLIKTESTDDEMAQTHYQFVTVTPDGAVGNTQDQHGTEIEFSQSVEPRCDGRVGTMTTWSRDANDSRAVTIRERRSDRDDKCRIIEDASTYRYYRLTSQNWHLDEVENKTVAEHSP
jgi:hypothetical protein